METRTELFVGGEWVEPASSETLTVISPLTEEPIVRVPHAQPPDMDRAVAAARRAFDEGPWPRTPIGERVAAVRALARGLEARSDEIANLVATEMGSPVSFGLAAQALAVVLMLDYFADLAENEFPFEERREGMIGPSMVRREPVGVCVGIVPWNAPLYLAGAKFGPALLAGCPIVLKPAPETPWSAYILAEEIAKLGLPPGLVSIVPAGRESGEHLVRNPAVDKVAFTGSTAAGKRIAQICGERLARYNLELGGKSACVVLPDAPVTDMVENLMYSGFMNNGQACIAQTRIVVPEPMHDEVVDALVERTAKLHVGDPRDPTVDIGPLFAERQRDRVEGYLAIGREEGATAAIGGGRPADFDRGWFVEPTVLVNVDNSMRVAREEIFGPVLSVIPYRDEADALRIANDSVYGLSGTVWGADVDRARSVAERMRTGNVTVNGFMIEFASPFGGFKESGVGREYGPEGLAEFTECKQLNLPAGSV